MLKQHAIPFFTPTIGDSEIASVVETLKSGWLTTGRKAKAFEEAFAEYVGAKHAVAVSSCTSALHLALEAVGVGPGDEVLVPTMTFASTGEVVAHLGARPVLVDCRADSMLVDPADIEGRITARTRAIMPVHYGGHPADMDAVHAIAQRHGLAVVEDAAHALPAEHRGRRIGSLSEATCFSFYANKTITTGEGGMLTTDREDIAARARIMSLHGISKDAWKRFSAEGSWYYEIHGAGYKSNMTDIAAAIGLHQLERCDEFLEGRRRCAEAYRRGLEGLPEIALPPVADDVQSAWHLFVIRVQHEMLTIDRNEFIKKLNEAGIGTSVHYMPLHMHPYYHDKYDYQPDDFPQATDAFHRIISLPIYPRMSDADLDRVVEVVRQTVSAHRAGGAA